MWALVKWWEDPDRDYTSEQKRSDSFPVADDMPGTSAGTSLKAFVGPEAAGESRDMANFLIRNFVQEDGETNGGQAFRIYGV